MSKRKDADSDLAEKTRFELRFDSAVYEKIKGLAETAEISVNQLMQGLARWAVSKAHAGEPERDEHGGIHTKPQAGCVWFGDEASFETYYDKETMEEMSKLITGELFAFLDFTERRVVREEERAPAKAGQQHTKIRKKEGEK